MKRCFKCERKKPASEFYPHPMMADGRLGKCKACTKADVKRWYGRTHTSRAAYERKRFATPARRAKAAEYVRMHRERHPERAKARQRTNDAIKRGILKRRPCRVCGNPKSQAHHKDYSKWWLIDWLCFKHHRAEHGQRTT